MAKQPKTYPSGNPRMSPEDERAGNLRSAFHYNMSYGDYVAMAKKDGRQPVSHSTFESYKKDQMRRKKTPGTGNHPMNR